MHVVFRLDLYDISYGNTELKRQQEVKKDLLVSANSAHDDGTHFVRVHICGGTPVFKVA